MGSAAELGLLAFFHCGLGGILFIWSRHALILGATAVRRVSRPADISPPPARFLLRWLFPEQLTAAESEQLAPACRWPFGAAVMAQFGLGR